MSDKIKKSKLIEASEISDIIFHNVSYTYSPKTPYEFKALKDVDLRIMPGKITAIIGSTGSGKSTLIQHINGLLIPSVGEIDASGFIIKSKQKKIKNVKKLRKSIGLVFQFPEYQLFEETVKKDIMFGPVNLGVSKDKAFELCKKYLKMVGLPEEFLERSPFDLSGGQKRRVAVAGILAMDGHTLILDEPTAGLDPEGEEDFIKLFQNINKKEEKRIILVTHNMDHVLQIADHVVAMKNGIVISEGTPQEIFSNEELLSQLEIAPPKIYKFIYGLAKQGLNVDSTNIREISDLAKAIKDKKTNKEVK